MLVDTCVIFNCESFFGLPFLHRNRNRVRYSEGWRDRRFQKCIKTQSLVDQPPLYLTLNRKRIFRLALDQAGTDGAYHT